MIDKLFQSVADKGVVCLGLDTRLDYLPENFRSRYAMLEEQLFQFNKRMIDATIDVVACYKVQIAYYEAYGLAGLIAYKNTLQYLKSVGAIVIADIKRGDIADTATQYAKAHFTGDFASDFITLNPYMGYETLEPYFPYLQEGKGIFVLVRTSNTGAKDIQYQQVGDQRIYEMIGDRLQQIGEKFLGKCGYSAIGTVMGCTNQEEITELRKRFDQTFFLIPGYGMQGGKAADVACFLKNGNGGVVNSSRAILLNYRNFADGAEKFDVYARQEAITMNNQIQKAMVKS